MKILIVFGEATMRFLEGHLLTKALRSLVRKDGELKIAVAYWGSAGLDLLGLNPRRKHLKIVCCLAGGKSDPDVIKKFGRRAKQDDRLHAKIVWTSTGAIVSSANASSNGLPEEEASSNGLIEAGVLIYDRNELTAIGDWIDGCYRRARSIKKQDLEAARVARKKRIWDGQGKIGARKGKQPLFQAMRDGGRLEFDQQRIFFAFFNDPLTARELARAKAVVRKNKETIAETLKISDSDFRGLEYYFNWPGLPPDAFLIDVESSRRGWRASRVFKTFDTHKTWIVPSDDGEVDRVTLARPARQAFPYTLGAKERAVIRAVGDQLWKQAKGDHSGRIISLKDAASYLLSQK
ncbi:phospholipase D family protein [Bradyrhizobium sp. WU425]|uniref:phospholipase D family protein n=1 Tax=Bradyrhizobium sp. WU425 TaxID=187029 RepID=UPI001E53DBDE|nr:phospholipase D family protein [Bradyrhizobium canariense]UFW72670.1 phospholipase D family protein [Bradyrhizobium canariense]